MTVRELIIALQKEDLDAQVLGEYDGTLTDLVIERRLRVNRESWEYSADSITENSDGQYPAVLLD
jgi:hypothetical protein